MPHYPFSKPDFFWSFGGKSTKMKHGHRFVMLLVVKRATEKVDDTACGDRIYLMPVRHTLQNSLATYYVRYPATFSHYEA